MTSLLSRFLGSGFHLSNKVLPCARSECWTPLHLLYTLVEGWGSTEMLQNLSDAKTKNYQLSKFLQEIDVPLVPWEACYDFRHSDHKSFAAVNYHVLCGGATGSSSKNKQRGCIGDSGSPLVCNSRGGKRLHGILLGGDPFCNHGSSYMIFTHIAKHRAWINRTTQVPSYQETQTGHRYPNVAKHQ